MTWYVTFQGNSREVFVFSESKTEGWEKFGNVSLECFCQIFEETRIQDPVQFTGTCLRFIFESITLSIVRINEIMNKRKEGWRNGWMGE